eukprot:scaffold13742_cov157-Amphora_coffeaeformis.AAC.6
MLRILCANAAVRAFRGKTKTIALVSGRIDHPHHCCKNRIAVYVTSYGFLHERRLRSFGNV